MADARPAWWILRVKFGEFAFFGTADAADQRLWSLARLAPLRRRPLDPSSCTDRYLQHISQAWAAKNVRV